MEIAIHHTMNSAISLDLTAFMESQALFEDITHDVLYFIQQRIRLVNYVIFVRNGEIAIWT